MDKQKTISLRTIHCPLGEMLIGAVDEGICLFDFKYRKMMPSILDRLTRFFNAEICEGDHPLFTQAEQQLNEYLNKSRRNFDLPLIFSGTGFQNKVWNELLKIPYGETRSYKQQATAIGDIKAIRAVATANGQNCFAIMIPCHRVIAENGDLTGYAGGINKKKWLLDFESRNSGRSIQTTLEI